MNYYDSSYYRMYAEHQETLRTYRASFLSEPAIHVNTNYRNWKYWYSNTEMNNIRFMVLAKELLSVENNFGNKEIGFLKKLYKVNCGERLAKHYVRLFIEIAVDPHSELEWALNEHYGCFNNNKNKEMVMKLFEIASLSRPVTLKEYNFIKNVAERLGISRNDFMVMQQQFRIEKADNNRESCYRQDNVKVPYVSFLAKAPGQYLYNQHYKNWRDLCYDKLLHRDDMKNLAFLVLASVVIAADGPINHAELNFMKKLYAQKSGAPGSSKIYMLKLRDMLKEPNVEWQTYADNLYNIFYEEDKGKAMRHWEKSKKEEILETLFGLADVDRDINNNELKALYTIAQRLEVVGSFQKLVSKYNIAKDEERRPNQPENSPLAKAYAVLQINANATDESVKSAYYKMLKQYHPDKCKDKSQKAFCEDKTIEIINAYNTITEYRKKNKRRT